MGVYTPVKAISLSDLEGKLIPCKQTLNDDGTWAKTCGFNDLIIGVKTIIQFLILVAIPVSVLLFAYAGILYIKEQEAAKNKAKSIFLSIIVGLFFMLGAWLIVDAVLKGLGAENSATDLLKK